jgi:ferredoxin
MKAHVNPDLCSGTGLCVTTCPQVFEINDNGMSTVKVDQIPTDAQQSCKQAAENCPTEAISIEE